MMMMMMMMMMVVTASQWQSKALLRPSERDCRKSMRANVVNSQIVVRLRISEMLNCYNRFTLLH